MATKLLIITQKVDVNDPVMGFFHGWIKQLSYEVEHLYVIGVGVGHQSLPANVSVYSLGKEKKIPRFLRYILFYWYILRLLPRIDGVFIHMCPEYVLAIYPINLFFKKPIVMWYAHIKVSRIAKWASRKTKAILSPSAESFELPGVKILKTGHGIDTNVFRPMNIPRTSNTTTILSLSRISLVKEIELLIEASRILRDKLGCIDFRVIIAGEPARTEDAEYQLRLKARISAYNLDGFFQWIGPIKNEHAPELYNSADIFVRMQTGGGFGKTELEAMACGVPSIIPTPVYNEQLGDFAKDVYWHDHNSEEFAGCLNRVMSWSPEKKTEYSELARGIVVKNHNIENLAKQVVRAMTP